MLRWARRGRPGGLSALCVLLTLTAACAGPGAPPRLGCAAGPVGRTPLTLDLEQARNAATIAGVGRRLGLPDHAVTVAIATAIQESGLHNLPSGDRDSLGLFQQRPSQGWGSPDRILIPRLSAAAFYARLQKVAGWQRLPVNDAAQSVQHSGLPGAYAQWEDQARLLAQVFTGEIAAGLSCTLARSDSVADPAVVEAQARLDLGARGLRPASAQAAWASAAWLVAHASGLHLRSVAAGGRQWRARTGTWDGRASATRTLSYS